MNRIIEMAANLQCINDIDMAIISHMSSIEYRLSNKEANPGRGLKNLFENSNLNEFNNEMNVFSWNFIQFP